MWQSLFERYPDLEARLLAAVRERVLKLPEAQGAGFPTLIDTQNTLGEVYGFSIERDPDRSELLAALADEEVHAATSASVPYPEASRLFREGQEALERGERDAALETWRRARDLDTGNWIIRKQIWAVEHPELFYPEIDTGWQKEQLIHEGYSCWGEIRGSRGLERHKRSGGADGNCREVARRSWRISTDRTPVSARSKRGCGGHRRS